MTTSAPIALKHPPRSGASPYRVLVIEASQTIREILKLHLSAAGYDVTVVEDAIGGGKILLSHPPDLLLCDVNLPYMDGLELLAAMRADEATSSIPVVFLTSCEDVQTYQRARSLRVNGYLNKPVKREELVAVIQRALAGEQAK